MSKPINQLHKVIPPSAINTSVRAAMGLPPLPLILLYRNRYTNAITGRVVQ